jgi:uncharacterized membrane protein (DUF2068 family)
VTELALVLLFTVAGIGAALLALRLAEGSRLILWSARIFCVLAIINLGVHVWRVLAKDPSGSVRAGALVGALVLIVLAYRRILRAVRGRRDRHPPP